MKRSIMFFLAVFLVLSLSAQQKSKQSLPVYPTSFERTKAQEPRQNLKQLPPHVNQRKNQRYTNASPKPSNPQINSYQKKAVDLGGKVRVILAVDKVFGNGNGYQLLLDADRTMYDSLIDLKFYPVADQYDAFEYVIPEGAFPKIGSPVVYDSQDTIEFAPGRFDMLIVGPDYGLNWFAASGDGVPRGKFKNVNFQGDFEYVFSISQHPTSPMSIGELITSVIKYDFSIERISIPSGYFVGTNDFKVKLTNHGSLTYPNSLVLKYQLNEGPVQTKTLANVPEPGKVDTVIVGTEDLTTAGKYCFKAWVNDTDGWNPLNDTTYDTIYSTGARAIPYFEKFDFVDMLTIKNEWKFIDANADNITWQIGSSDCRDNDDSRCLLYNFSEADDANDFAISPPLDTKKGKHTLLFRAKARGDQYEEKVVIMVNSSPKEEGATILDTLVMQHKNWLAYGEEFDVAADGKTYIIFKAISLADQYGIFIDEVMVKTGTAIENYESELEVKNVLIPYSNCDLGTNEKIEVVVKNNGIIPTKGVQVSVKLDNNTTITENFPDLNVPVDEQAAIAFNTKFDLSAEGVHTFTTLVASAESQTGSSNTFITKVHKLSALELPINNPNFEDPDALWYSEVYGSWKYDEKNKCMVAQHMNVSLLSHCFSVKKDKTYRIAIEYMGGIITYTKFFDEFEVLVGESGSAISTWKNIGMIENIASDSPEMFDFDFTAPDNGSYMVGIRSIETPEDLRIFNVIIDTLQDYDVRITNISSNIPALVPIHFLDKAGYKLSTTVQNRGNKAATDVKTTLSMASTALNTSAAKTIEFNKTAIFENPVTLTNPTIGLKEFKVSAAFSQTDVDLTDNDETYSITATDTVLGSDRVIEFSNGVGSTTSKISLGNAYRLPVQDTLGGIFIGFGGEEMTKLPFTLSVYLSATPDPGSTDTLRVGKQILTVELERPVLTAGGLVYYPLRPIVLPAATYFFELNQLTNTMIQSAFDEDPNGYFFVRAAVNFSLKNSSFGNLAIRPIFPKVTKLITSDIGVSSINKPVKTINVFAANEVIEATVQNFGLVDITDSIRVRCQVGNAIKEKKIKGLTASQTATVSFEMDLSAPGIHQIMVYTVLEADQERSNDTAKKKVTCISPSLSPYKLDFEECVDFSTTDFIPEWTTVDVNGLTTYYFEGYKFPGMGEPHAYLVMNPSLATPSLSKIISPHGGERMGISFAEGIENSDEIFKSNDWLISPKLVLGSQSKLAFYAMAFPKFVETFQVWVSTTDNKLTSFTAVGEEVEVANTTWQLYEVDLSAYDGTSIHVAIQCVSEDQFTFCIDDIEVRTSVSNQASKNDRIQLYPNPAKDFFMLYQPEMDIREVQVYDAMGRKVFGSTNVETRTYRINTQGFNKGVYIVRILTDDGYSSHKVVIE